MSSLGSRLDAKYTNKDTKDVDSTPGLRKGPVYRIIKAQTVTTILVSASLMLVNPVFAYSVFLGGLVAILPGLGQAIYWSGKMVGVKQILLGEIAKIGLSALIFLLIFVLVAPISLGFLLGTFAVLQLFYMLVPLLAIRS